jgi:hypothetical protein
MKRWLVLSGVVLVVATVLVAFVLRSGDRREGTIVGLAADPGGAIVVWNTSREDAKVKSWVTRVDREGNEVWTADLPGYAMSVGATPIILAGDVVAVRYGASGLRFTDSSVAAYELADGKRLWNDTIAPYHATGTDSRPHLPGSAGVGFGDLFVAFADEGQGTTTAIGLSARGGKRAWKEPIASFSAKPIAAGELLAVRSLETTFLANAASGMTTEVPTGAAGCLRTGGYVVPVRSQRGDRSWDLVEVGPGRPQRQLAAPFAALAPAATVHGCAMNGERIVLFTAAEALITDPTGSMLHQVPIGGLLPSSAPSGEVPRHALVPASDANGFALVMLDLETGRIDWRSTSFAELPGVLRTKTHWIAVLRETIVGFDGTTGKLVGAVSAHSYNGILGGAEVAAEIASADTLWIYGGDRATTDAAPLTAIDLATMKPRFARTVEVADITARVKAQLGLP